MTCFLPITPRRGKHASIITVYFMWHQKRIIDAETEPETDIAVYYKTDTSKEPNKIQNVHIYKTYSDMTDIQHRSCMFFNKQ